MDFYVIAVVFLGLIWLQIEISGYRSIGQIMYCWFSYFLTLGDPYLNSGF